MHNILEQSESGRKIARVNREQGIAENRHATMRTLLLTRFGDIADLDDLARKLAGNDYQANIARIADGAGLDDLRA